MLELQSDSTLDIPIKPIAPNSKQEILFEVSNQKDQKQSEITMQYEQVKLTANTTDQIKYGFSEQVNHKYKLEINWNTNAENYNSYKYSKTISIKTNDYLEDKINTYDTTKLVLDRANIFTITKSSFEKDSEYEINFVKVDSSASAELGTEIVVD